MTLTHGSLFAGIDAFGYGFAKAGIKTLWRVEIDRDCQRVLRRHHPDDLLLSDVRECGAHNLPPADIISFGSPCQDISGAGKQVGLMGDRSVLFFEGVRILAELQPTFAVWENVPRARTIHRGRDFATILRAFRECGARDIAWRTLDARYCGVAQRRQRIFLVADFRGERAAEILFEPARSSWHPAASRKAGPRVAATITSGIGITGNASGRRREDDVNLVCATINSGGNSGGFRTEPGEHLVVDSDVHAYQCQGSNVGEMGTIRRGNGGLTGGVPFTVHTITSEGFDGSEDGTGRGIPLVFDPTQITSPGNYSNPKAGDPCHPIAASAQAPCIAFDWQSGGDVRLNISERHTSAITKSQVHATMQGMCVRRLTPTEVERLFAFPDGYTTFDADGRPISDSARYRMLGNSIVTTIPEWLGRRILAAEAANATRP